ncbi:general substrate transporter [Vararia minispora EC-137]|uniref:General substrate transporter n=1 Tax=Vararia minispora EC-137 TaxID=1314806 RepID=A0ACB8QWG9_9AGAM|nr:general substrate transporter [Vararia minispora EC-137]
MPMYVWCAVLACTSGYIFGFDTGSIGPITLMQDFIHTFGPFSSTVQGLIVSSILIPAALMSLFSGSLADRLSRTYSVSLGCAVYGTGSLISSLSAIHTSRAGGFAMIFIGRILSGLGEGIFLSAATVYSVEVAPANFRGRVGCILQFMICLGQMVGYFVCYGSLNMKGSLSWRLPWILQAIMCTAVGISVRFLPNSPRWLLHVGRREDAERVVVRLGLDADEFFAAEEQEKAAQAHAERPKESGWRASVRQFREAFAPGVRGRSAMAIFMLGMQQLSGIDAILYYAPVVFRQAGIGSDRASFLASGVTTIVNLVVTGVGQIFSDHWGRRTALISGAIVMASAMTVIGALYSAPDLSSAGLRAIIVSALFVFFIAFILTWGILMRVWVSEAQPVQSRASVSSLALVSNWGVNWIVAFTTPIFLDASPSGPYFLFGGCLWLSAFIFWLWLPETRGTDLGALGVNLSLRIEPRWLRRKFSARRPALSRRTTLTLVGEDDDEKEDVDERGPHASEVVQETRSVHTIT